MTELFLDIVNMSISAGWLVLAVLVLRIILKNAPKWVNVMLWGIVAIRLICPLSIESPVSLIPNAVGNGELISGWMDDYVGDIDIHHPNTDHYDAAIQAGLEPVYDGEGGYYVVTKHNQYAQPETVENTVVPVLAIVWLAGMAIMALYTAISYLSLARKLRTAVRLRENIFQCETVPSPCVLGLLKPRIYLPFDMDKQNREHVIAHERAHIRRNDHWWKSLGFLLLTVHWFNPLMWAAYILLCRDIELACDEKVIGSLGHEQRAEYTQALVACSVSRFHVAACPLAFGEVGVKERVRSIMNYRKPTFWIMVAAVAVCVGVAVCFLTNPTPSPEFPMTGNNVRDLNVDKILDRIFAYEDISNSNVYMNSANFSMTVDSDFNWVNSQTVRYFFWEDHKTQSAQLRIFPDENKYFLTESGEWTEQNRIFLLRHYLEAIKYLPQEAIAKLAPADQYQILHIDGGQPDDFDRVITYSSEGVGETDGWYLHLRLEPLHALSDGGFHGTGDEVVELFYGDANGNTSQYAQKWFDYTEDNSEMSYENELKIQLAAFPDTVFRYTPYDIVATTGGENSRNDTSLIQGMPIWSAYFCDLNGDGLPEICAHASVGSGIIDNRVMIFDYANSIRYELADRGNHDYYLRMNDGDGCLYVDKKAYMSSKVIASERLVWENGGIAIDRMNFAPIAILRAQILEIHDGYFLVEPVEGSRELRSASKIEIPMKNMISSPEPEVGDVLEIEYDGQIMESYPARISNVYSIRVTKQEKVSAAYFVPTDTDLQGLHAGALLVPIDGNIYRYMLSEYEPEGITVKELLFEFEEPLSNDSIHWSVYSLKEYPDHLAVLMLSDREDAWLCRYQPPQACADTAMEDAIHGGCAVMEEGLATHGKEIWDEFYDLIRQGKPASVTVAHSYTLDPKDCDDTYYEVFRQDYPCLYEYRLEYDGKLFTLTEPDDGEGGSRTFAYLMKYDNTEFYSQSSQASGRRFDYVLTQDNRITWDQIWNAMVTSYTGNNIEHYTVYSERIE